MGFDMWSDPILVTETACISAYHYWPKYKSKTPWAQLFISQQEGYVLTAVGAYIREEWTNIHRIWCPLIFSLRGIICVHVFQSSHNCVSMQPPLYSSYHLSIRANNDKKSGGRDSTNPQTQAGVSWVSLCSEYIECCGISNRFKSICWYWCGGL